LQSAAVAGRIGEVLARAAQAIKIAGQNSWIRDVALDTLTLGRTHLALALQTDASTTVTDTSHPARVAAKEFDRAVEGLLAAGENEFVAAGLLARGDFRRAVGDWKGAARDLGEAKEIAESGLMRLYWCDSAFAGVRLALAQREAFAPLNGLFEPTPPPPILPDPDTAAALREEAREQLDVARKLIAECGYHRRDEELAELDDVIAGGRRFADLPPASEARRCHPRCGRCGQGGGRGRDLANRALRVETSFRFRSRPMVSGFI
jgi:hypothetical protein